MGKGKGTLPAIELMNHIKKQKEKGKEKEMTRSPNPPQPRHHAACPIRALCLRLAARAACHGRCARLLLLLSMAARALRRSSAHGSTAPGTPPPTVPRSSAKKHGRAPPLLESRSGSAEWGRGEGAAGRRGPGRGSARSSSGCVLEHRQIGIWRKRPERE